MDLTRALTRTALRRVHVLLVDTPGALPVRWAAEQAMARRGWVTAESVADADLLLECGEPGSDLAMTFDDVWDRVTLPRARARVRTAAEVDAVLDRAGAALADHAGQRPPSTAEHAQSHDEQSNGEQPDDEQSHDRQDGDDEDADSDMDMDMDMDGPGGLPLASGAQDRDGLEMDVLHVPLGPALPAWPAGLVLTCTLAGDVITGAAVEVLPAADPPPAALPSPADPDRLETAGRIDLVARVLDLAGRADLATRARAVRTAVLAADGTSAGPEWQRVRRTVERSRTLRWSLLDLGLLDAPLLADHRLPGGLEGGVLQRLGAAAHLDPGDAAVPGWPGRAPEGWRERLLGLLPELLIGRELAEVRLLLASLPVDLTVGTELPVVGRG